eukprot:TRINITY_DN9870_c0_g1_i1.p1 TRINITY_DN9870_c0_g1~~TRINITY_DN9870_c0_g1_i1.p1  ORF type:complete len:251 (+),score=45.76 TRINITY_DN9870_c0_g1_i1:106-858(+)
MTYEQRKSNKSKYDQKRNKDKQFKQKSRNVLKRCSDYHTPVNIYRLDDHDDKRAYSDVSLNPDCAYQRVENRMSGVAFSVNKKGRWDAVFDLYEEDGESVKVAVTESLQLDGDFDVYDVNHRDARAMRLFYHKVCPSVEDPRGLEEYRVIQGRKGKEVRKVPRGISEVQEQRYYSWTDRKEYIRKRVHYFPKAYELEPREREIYDADVLYVVGKQPKYGIKSKRNTEYENTKVKKQKKLRSYLNLERNPK